jgi:hypothetical protein
MFDKKIHRVFTLLAVSALACAGSADDGAITIGDVTTSDVTTGDDNIGDDFVVAESALVLPPKRCERMTFALSPLTPNIPQRSMVAPGPYVARITNAGKEISCSLSNTGTIATNFTWRESLVTPNIVPYRISGGTILFGILIPAQDNPSLITIGASPFAGRPFRSPIQTISCIPPTVTLKTPGFPDRRVSAFATIKVLPQLFPGEPFTIECQAHVRGPVSSFRDRPAELISAGGDRFTYVCDVPAAQRRSACSAGICTIQCTSSVTQPFDTAGISQCINSCADRCAATPCAPVLCTGSDCPSGSCAPANVCSTNAQCGAGRVCGGTGCCITNIR